MSAARIAKRFQALLSEMGQKAPKNDGEREIFRRIFIQAYSDGWKDAEAVGFWTHLMRLLRWQ